MIQYKSNFFKVKVFRFRKIILYHQKMSQCEYNSRNMHWKNLLIIQLKNKIKQFIFN